VKKETSASSTKSRVDVQEAIIVHVVTDGLARGWAHTHGLSAFDEPELEIRGLPCFMAPSAVGLLNTIADYMLNDATKPIRAGQNMDLGRVVVRFEEGKPDESAGYDNNHYETRRLTLVDVESVPCDACTKAGDPKN
jgi:hypothetical protein